MGVTQVLTYPLKCTNSYTSGQDWANVAHKKKETGTYCAFPSSLFGLKFRLIDLKCIGNDGETALFAGF